MKSLVLAEKPSVARELARVLKCTETHRQYIEGPNHVITWALGHLMELKMPEDYDNKYKTWTFDDLPMIPSNLGIKPIQKTRGQLRAIEQLSRRHDIKDFIIATDAGREGELVARWILERIKWKKQVHRLWISSQTDQAIRSGFNQLKPGKDYEKLYHSAKSRAEADWLVGLNISRALTIKYNEPLSAGRVQTPTLGLIIAHEKTINAFVPEPYWTIELSAAGLSFRWQRGAMNRINQKELADKISNKISGQSLDIKKISKKIKTEEPPLPYDLTELQRDANRRYGFSARKTLQVLQGLYEQHKLVTYPRTDSRYLTNDIRSTLVERLKGMVSEYGKEVNIARKNGVEKVNKKIFNDAKVTDHHAIIPTEQPLYFNDLSSDEQKLYDLIAIRFLSLFYGSYQYETASIEAEIAGEMFRAKTTRVITLGFRNLSPLPTDNGTDQVLPKTGDTLPTGSPALKEHLTEAPAPYNEADLLTKMEKYHLGTPATRAEIIEKIIHAESVERRKGKLYSTPKGKQLIQLVPAALTSPELTSEWEQQLEAITLNKVSPEQFRKSIIEETQSFVSNVKESEMTYKAHNLTGSKCPECNSLMKEVNGRQGKMLVCSNRECNHKKYKEPKKVNKRCPKCHQKMEIHKGKAGTYFQCKKCNVVEKAENKKKTVNKREQQQLLKTYGKQETLGNSLADALKAAMNKDD